MRVEAVAGELGFGGTAVIPVLHAVVLVTRVPAAAISATPGLALSTSVQVSNPDYSLLHRTVRSGSAQVPNSWTSGGAHG